MNEEFLALLLNNKKLEENINNGSVDPNKTCQCDATMLLIDDTAFNLYPLLSKLKNGYNINCAIAVDGREGVKLYEKDVTKTCCNTKFKMILTDIMMPIMDGYEAAKEINKICKRMQENNPEMPDIPILAITADVNSNTPALCEESGIISAISKPFQEADL